MFDINQELGYYEMAMFGQRSREDGPIDTYIFKLPVRTMKGQPDMMAENGQAGRPQSPLLRQILSVQNVRRIGFASGDGGFDHAVVQLDETPANLEYSLVNIIRLLGGHTAKHLTQIYNTAAAPKPVASKPATPQAAPVAPKPAPAPSAPAPQMPEAEQVEEIEYEGKPSGVFVSSPENKVLKYVFKGVPAGDHALTIDETTTSPEDVIANQADYVAHFGPLAVEAFKTGKVVKVETGAEQGDYTLSVTMRMPEDETDFIEEFEDFACQYAEKARDTKPTQQKPGIEEEELQVGDVIIENALKFLVPTQTMQGRVVQLTDKNEASRLHSNVGRAVLTLPGVERVTFGTVESDEKRAGWDYVTVTRQPGVSWDNIRKQTMNILGMHITAVEKNLSKGLVSLALLEAEKTSDALIAEFQQAARDEKRFEHLGISQIKAAFALVNDVIAKDGGQVNFVRLNEDELIEYTLEGACNGCTGSEMTVKKTLDLTVPVIVKNIQVQGYKNVTAPKPNGAMH